MDSFTVTIPIDYWINFVKTHSIQSILGLSFIFGTFSHARQLSKIRKWNASKEKWSIEKNLPLPDDYIRSDQIIIGYFLYLIFGLLFNLIWFIVRIVYSILLRPILSLIAGKWLSPMKSIKNTFDSNSPGDRFDKQVIIFELVLISLILIVYIGITKE